MPWPSWPAAWATPPPTAAWPGPPVTGWTAALAVTRGLGLDDLVPELIAVTLANIAAAAFRFSILRTWVFRPRFGTHLDPVALADNAGSGAVDRQPTVAHSTPQGVSR